MATLERKTIWQMSVGFTGVFLLVCLFKVLTYKPSSEERISKHWSRQEFTPINETQDFKSKIFALPINSDKLLPSVQSQALRQTAYNMAMAFYLGTYESYRLFRTPVPPKSINPVRTEVAKRLLADDWRYPDHTIPSDPETIFQRDWEVVFLNKYVDTPVENSTIGKHFWDAIALSQSDITVTKSNSIPPLLNQQIPESVGFCIYLSSFIFTNTPEDVLARDGEITTAVIKLLVEHPAPEPKFPVYCRVYWDEACEAWLPMEFVTPTHLNRTREYVF